MLGVSKPIKRVMAQVRIEVTLKSNCMLSYVFRKSKDRIVESKKKWAYVWNSMS